MVEQRPRSAKIASVCFSLLLCHWFAGLLGCTEPIGIDNGDSGSPGGGSGTPLANPIAAGDQHTCAVVNGGLLCWGDNEYGQLGNNSTDSGYAPAAVQGLSTGVQAATAGVYHTCAIVNGGVRCWGQNKIGQLGNGSTTDSHVPVAVQGLSRGAQAVAAGDYHTPG